MTREQRPRRYLLQGFFNAEMGLHDLLRDYYFSCSRPS